MAEQESRCITIRFPKALWVQLRRLQEEGKIKSIQRAVIDALQAKIWLKKE